MPAARIEDIVEVNGVEHIRVPVHAKMRLASPPPSMMQEGMASSDIVKAVADLYYHDVDNPDLVWVSFILDSEGPNNNWDHMPRTQLIASHATAKYKPFDANHLVKENDSILYSDKLGPISAKNTIFGVMTHTAVADYEGNVLSDKAIAKLDKGDDPFRPEEERITVVAWAAMYAFLFPKTVTQLVQAIARDEMHVSMERWIRQWDFLARDPGDTTYSTVARTTAEKNGMFDKWAKREYVNQAAIYRRSLAYSYGGVASTADPANPMSRFRDMNSDVNVKAAASLDDPILEILVNLHDELHDRFTVSSSREEKAMLETHHLRLTRAIAERLK